MAGWHDTIDRQIRLNAWWATSEGIVYGDGFIESLREKGDALAGGDHASEPGWLSRVARGQLTVGEPFFVSDDVFELVSTAVESFGDEPLLATDLITPHGFVLLPKPVFSEDRNGKSINTRAFSWGPCEGSATPAGAGASAPAVGTYLMMYSDSNVKDDFYDEMNEPQMKALWTPTHGLSLWHMTPWWFGTGRPKIAEYAGNGYLWRWLQAFFRMSMQQIVTAQRMLPPRPFAKRAKRAGRDPGVLVMQLRRRTPKYVNGEGEGRDWQFQWVTRGHWRNQWYPSLGAHRQIWIAPYVKGPEGKPLKQPDLRAWTFTR